jgi:hypothetical protein
VHDEYEPLDPEHEAVVKDEPDPDDEYTPLDLDQIEADYRAHLSESAIFGRHGTAVIGSVPGLIAEVRRLRERLAVWEALPVRWEYAIGKDDQPPHPDVVTTTDKPFGCQVADAVEQPLYGRPVHVGDFVELRAEAPF